MGNLQLGYKSHTVSSVPKVTATNLTQQNNISAGDKPNEEQNEQNILKKRKEFIAVKSVPTKSILLEEESIDDRLDNQDIINKDQELDQETGEDDKSDDELYDESKNKQQKVLQDVLNQEPSLEEQVRQQHLQKQQIMEQQDQRNKLNNTVQKLQPLQIKQNQVLPSEQLKGTRSNQLIQNELQQVQVLNQILTKNTPQKEISQKNIDQSKIVVKQEDFGGQYINTLILNHASIKDIFSMQLKLLQKEKATFLANRNESQHPSLFSKIIMNNQFSLEVVDETSQMANEQNESVQQNKEQIILEQNSLQAAATIDSNIQESSSKEMLQEQYPIQNQLLQLQNNITSNQVQTEQQVDQMPEQQQNNNENQGIRLQEKSNLEENKFQESEDQKVNNIDEEEKINNKQDNNPSFQQITQDITNTVQQQTQTTCHQINISNEITNQANESSLKDQISNNNISQINNTEGQVVNNNSIEESNTQKEQLIPIEEGELLENQKQDKIQKTQNSEQLLQQQSSKKDIQSNQEIQNNNSQVNSDENEQQINEEQENGNEENSQEIIQNNIHSIQVMNQMSSQSILSPKLDENEILKKKRKLDYDFYQIQNQEYVKELIKKNYEKELLYKKLLPKHQYTQDCIIGNTAFKFKEEEDELIKNTYTIVQVYRHSLQNQYQNELYSKKFEGKILYIQVNLRIHIIYTSMQLLYILDAEGQTIEQPIFIQFPILYLKLTDEDKLVFIQSEGHFKLLDLKVNGPSETILQTNIHQLIEKVIRSLPDDYNQQIIKQVYYKKQEEELVLYIGTTVFLYNQYINEWSQLNPMIAKLFIDILDSKPHLNQFFDQLCIASKEYTSSNMIKQPFQQLTPKQQSLLQLQQLQQLQPQKQNYASMQIYSNGNSSNQVQVEQPQQQLNKFQEYHIDQILLQQHEELLLFLLRRKDIKMFTQAIIRYAELLNKTQQHDKIRKLIFDCIDKDKNRYYYLISSKDCNPRRYAKELLRIINREDLIKEIQQYQLIK